MRSLFDYKKNVGRIFSLTRAKMNHVASSDARWNLITSVIFRLDLFERLSNFVKHSQLRCR
jgi:hypothetical protein